MVARPGGRDAGLDAREAARYRIGVRSAGGLVAISAWLGACGGAEPRPATPAPGPLIHVADGPRRPGGAVRVEVARAHGGFRDYVGVWIHEEQDQHERLEIADNGRFEWHITRSSSQCEIAGGVELTEVPVADVPHPALTWTMTVNTCNGNYQGKRASDVIVDHDHDFLILRDAEIELAPVYYDRDAWRDRAPPPPPQPGP